MRLTPYRSNRLVVTMILLGLVGPIIASIRIGDFQSCARAEQPAASSDSQSPVNVTVKSVGGKGIAFEMRDKPWSSVLEWLSDQTGLPIITTHKPTGTFSFISSKKKTYTLPEIIDILNEGLISQKYLLIRRDQSFTLVPADEKIDPAILPRVRVEDLTQRGNTEIVSVVLPLTSLVAEDLAPEVQKMKGPFGEVIAMNKANQLILQDTVGNIKRIVKTVKDIEENEKGQAESFSYPCKYIKARDAEAIVTKLLGDPRELVRLAQPQQPGFPGFGGRGGLPQPAPMMTVVAPKIRMHYVTADERTNTVLITGPADKIAQGKDILKHIDVPQERGGTAELKTYSVSGGTAEALAKTLTEIYKNSTSIRISNAGTNTILVWATPDVQMEIAQQITGSHEKNTKTEMVQLNNLEASKVAETLKGMFGDSKTGAPFIEADTTRNGIVVRGTTTQVADVKAALQAIGESGGSDSTMRIITLDKGSAATLAEALGRLLPQMRQNPVRVIIPGKAESKPAAKSSASGEEEQEPQDPRTKENSEQLTDPQKKEPSKNKPGNKNSPITITAFGNRLIVTSDDPNALALVQELVRLLTHTPSGEGDFEVIKLKNASATDAARVLDEAFNGTKPQATQVPQFGFGRFGAPAAPTNPTENRIRVVADPATNSLLVRANPLDMITIRHLLDTALDNGETESKAIAATKVIGPLKFASATEVASVIRDVYREHMNNNPQPTQVGGIGGFGFFRGGGRGGAQNLNVDANGNPRAITLSVAVDDRTNSLIVSCSNALYVDVKKLTDQLDLAAKDATRTVRVVSTKGIDPVLVQQAIDAIQGRRTTRQSSSTGQATQPNQPTFVPGGTGGIIAPGMNPMRGGGNNGGGNNNGRGNGPPGRQSFNSERGSDFFADRVKDDPQPSLLYDPHPGSTASEESNSSVNLTQEAASAPSDRPAGSQEEQQAGAAQPGTQPLPGGALAGPRAPVTAEALEQLGIVVVSGNSGDVEEVVRIIEMLQKLGAGAEVQIQLVPLDHADATSVSNTLSQLYQRVIIGPTSSTITRPTTTTTQTPFGGQASTQTAGSSVILVPVPRLNAILIGAPKTRVVEIIKEIKRLDQVLEAVGKAKPFQLKKASASRVATLLTNFYAGRYANETVGQDQVRITYDDSTNTVFVQAAPADMTEIRDLIWRVDNTVSEAINDLKIVPLKNVLADEMTAILQQAITQGIVAPSVAPGIVPTAGGAAGARGPGGTTGALPGATGASATPGTATKTTSLRFLSPLKGGRALESGLLEDIHITSDTRINAVIISAPAKTMDLLLTLIRELDVLPSLRAEINIFPLKQADASTMAVLIQQLFLGTGASSSTSGTGTTTSGAGTGTGGGLPGAIGGPASAGAASALSTSTARPAAPVSMAGTTPEGTPLIALRITVDQRTNSIIAAGSRNDLTVIEAIISRLEDADVQQRTHQVYALRNAAAADVATALTNFLTSSLRVLQVGQGQTAFQEIEREVVVVPEPITNKLLISATPRYFQEIVRLVQELDASPAQVVIQALIAEVDLSNNEEFGIELGLQSPVLFQRSVIPAPGALGTGSITYTNPGLVPQGVTVNNSINPAALPGFNFNNTGPLGNNPLVNPGLVGFQGLGNLGVGRSSPLNSGVGGFVFSAASDSFNLLIRALKMQGRIDILSRPQITTLDNQQSEIVVGQSVPYVQGATVNSLGNVTPIINYRNVGIVLQVTPRISPDGRVLMRVHPEVSSLAQAQINLGNGILATEFNDQFVDTTVVADDGETVAIGGLITKRDMKMENKIPWFGDLPYVGALFRYRIQDKNKSELLVILTPHIIRSRFEADAILAQESKRMEWILGDVVKVHGTTGLEPILPPKKGGPNACGLNGKGAVSGPLPDMMPTEPVPTEGVFSPQFMSPSPGAIQGPGQATPAPSEVLPTPQIVPPGSPQGTSQPPLAPTEVVSPPEIMPPGSPQGMNQTTPAPTQVFSATQTVPPGLPQGMSQIAPVPTQVFSAPQAMPPGSPQGMNRITPAPTQVFSGPQAMPDPPPQGKSQTMPTEGVWMKAPEANHFAGSSTNDSQTGNWGAPQRAPLPTEPIPNSR